MKSQRHWLIELFQTLLAALIIVIIVHTFIGRMFVIPSGSMEPTLHGCPGCTGDRIVTEKISYYRSDPKPGDVVVFKGPESWQMPESANAVNPIFRGLAHLGVGPGTDDILVKRVIAVGGQTVSCQKGDPAIMVDGKPTDQSFILTPPARQAQGERVSEECGGPFFDPITVPEDHLWVMGDNRTYSADSRFHIGDELQGTIPVDNVLGRAVVRVWPIDRIGTIPEVTVQ